MQCAASRVANKLASSREGARSKPLTSPPPAAAPTSSLWVTRCRIPPGHAAVRCARAPVVDQVGQAGGACSHGGPHFELEFEIGGVPS